MSIALLLSLLSSISNAGVLRCFDKSNIAAVNIAFDYRGQPAANPLNGVREDRPKLERIAAKFAGTTRNIGDRDLFGKPNPKQEILDIIKRQAEGKSGLMLNYSGHGVVTASGTFGMLLPTVDGEKCIKQEVRVDSVRGYNLERGSEIYRGMMAQSAVERRLTLGRSPGETAPAPPPPTVRTVDVMKFTVDVYDDSNPECRASLITVEEIKAVAGNKVFGLLDSCFSGAISESAQGEGFLYSSQANETSADLANGGRLITAVDDLLTNHLCRFTGMRNYASFDQVATVLPRALVREGFATPGDTAEVRMRSARRLSRASPPEVIPETIVQENVVGWFNPTRDGQGSGYTGHSGFSACTTAPENFSACIDSATRQSRIGRDSIAISNEFEKCEFRGGAEINVVATSENNQFALIGSNASTCKRAYWIQTSRLQAMQPRTPARPSNTPASGQQ